MEKEIGKIKKNETTNIIVRVDEYKGKRGLTIREFVTSEKYTGFSKSGTRIPADEFLNFRDMINSVNLDDLTSSEKEAKKDEGEEKTEQEEEKPKKAKKPKKEEAEETEEETEVKEESEEESEEAE
ncbi:MAG: PC4/YdbC family ssDNA-binding protein [Nanoarchaeota archaeon]|nr:PC4/YdbC family ssDNA-binding protein [Nanoarchaeota archaeon]